MQPIDPRHLESICGGAGGALLGTLAQSAGPILNGVASIIGAAKSGRGGAPAAAAPSGPPSGPPSGMGGGGDGLVSVSVAINGVQTAVKTG